MKNKIIWYLSIGFMLNVNAQKIISTRIGPFVSMSYKGGEISTDSFKTPVYLPSTSVCAGFYYTVDEKFYFSLGLGIGKHYGSTQINGYEEYLSYNKKYFALKMAFFSRSNIDSNKTSRLRAQFGIDASFEYFNDFNKYSKYGTLNLDLVSSQLFLGLELGINYQISRRNSISLLYNIGTQVKPKPEQNNFGVYNSFSHGLCLTGYFSFKK